MQLVFFVTICMFGVLALANAEPGNIYINECIGCPRIQRGSKSDPIDAMDIVGKYVEQTLGQFAGRASGSVYSPELPNYEHGYAQSDTLPEAGQFGVPFPVGHYNTWGQPLYSLIYSRGHDNYGTSHIPRGKTYVYINNNGAHVRNTRLRKPNYNKWESGAERTDGESIGLRDIQYQIRKVERPLFKRLSDVLSYVDQITQSF
ncbi:uncharacterized protein LOC117791256 [Drosophila innubila]|uniref:uncharacterized protein LOC117791256 n=1 Tax=Drosophila innubila TaxID=198719 RepID=UPI00148D6DB9|nr:uncharacterized protein LOC117791256 [Drosophila innubila]